MIAADDWRKYQESYVKYGIDLKPEAERPKKKTKSKSSVRVTAQEKTIILMMIAAIGVCCIIMIFLQACTSNINYSIYTLNQEISSISDDIDNLNVELNSANKLGDIEYYALNDLLMVYPDQEQYVYVEDLKGSAEVESYIASLTASQKGITVQKNATVAVAAKHLLAQA